MIGTDRKEVIERALKNARESTERATYAKFSVYVGTLTHKVEQPITYELIPIKDGE